MKIQLKKLDEAAKMPFKKHIDDFCYDIYATYVEEIAPNVLRYHTGLAMQMVRDQEPVHYIDNNTVSTFDLRGCQFKLSIDVRPRSSVWETGLVLANAEPTIDEGYTGEVMLTFYHVLPDMPAYKPGDRIGQMKIGFTVPIDFEWVDEFKETERGAGGYGSTGKK